MRSIAVAFLLVVSILTSFAEAPETVVRRFVDALNSKNFEVMAKLVKGASLMADVRALLSQDNAPEMKIERVTAKITGSKASVTAYVSAPDYGQDPRVESVNLVKSGESWLLVHEIGNRGNMNSVVAMCIDLHLVFSQAKEVAAGTQCLSNTKQLCLGLIMVSMDNDGFFRLTAKTWQAKIMPYVKNKYVFNCTYGPATGPTFSFNVALLGKNIDEVKIPETLVMVYEGTGRKLRFHPDGKTSVGFADGHAKRLTAAEAKKLRWKP